MPGSSCSALARAKGWLALRNNKNSAPLFWLNWRQLALVVWAASAVTQTPARSRCGRWAATAASSLVLRGTATWSMSRCAGVMKLTSVRALSALGFCSSGGISHGSGGADGAAAAVGRAGAGWAFLSTLPSRCIILVRVQAETNNPGPCTDAPHPVLVRSQPWQARFQGSHHPGHV